MGKGGTERLGNPSKVTQLVQSEPGSEPREAVHSSLHGYGSYPSQGWGRGFHIYFPPTSTLPCPSWWASINPCLGLPRTQRRLCRQTCKTNAALLLCRGQKAGASLNPPSFRGETEAQRAELFTCQSPPAGERPAWDSMAGLLLGP